MVRHADTRSLDAPPRAAVPREVDWEVRAWLREAWEEADDKTICQHTRVARVSSDERRARKAELR